MAKGNCEACSAKRVEIFKLAHYGKACRYCKAVYLSSKDTNAREDIALMFNALEQALKER